jgi:hypothetical protein
MPGIVSTILNYYGLIHLAYYSSQQFLETKKEGKDKDSANESTAADETLVIDEPLYLWLSKW